MAQPARVLYRAGQGTPHAFKDALALMQCRSIAISTTGAARRPDKSRVSRGARRVRHVVIEAALGKKADEALL